MTEHRTTMQNSANDPRPPPGKGWALVGGSDAGNDRYMYWKRSTLPTPAGQLAIIVSVVITTWFAATGWMWLLTQTGAL